MRTISSGKPPNYTKLNKKMGEILQESWYHKLFNMLGEPVLVTNRREKKAPKYLAEVLEVYDHHSVFRYTCYDSKGEFRCYQTISISYNSLICGEDEVIPIGRSRHKGKV